MKNKKMEKPVKLTGSVVNGKVKLGTVSGASTAVKASSAFVAVNAPFITTAE